MKKNMKLVITAGLILALTGGCAKEADKKTPAAPVVAEPVAVEWSTAHNGPESEDDRMFGVVEISDGGYIAVGNSENSDETENGFFARYDAQGKQLWVQYAENTHLNAVIETPQGFLTVGSSVTITGEEKNQDAAAILFDQDGKVIWTTTLKGSGYDALTGHGWSGSGYPLVLSNGNYLILGNTYSADEDFADIALGKGDGFLAELDTKGNIVSIRGFGGSGYDSLQDMYALEDGSILITGYASANHDDETEEVFPADGMFDGLELEAEDNSIYVSKLDAEYNILWTKIIPAHGPWVLGMEPAQDGGIMLAADGVEEPGEDQPTSLTLFKLDAEGNVLWNKNYDNNKDDAASIFVTSLETAADGNLILSGEVHYQSKIEEDAEGMRGWLGCISPEGELLWERNFEGSDYELHIHAAPTSDNGVVLAAQQASEQGDWDAVLLKYAPYEQ